MTSITKPHRSPTDALTSLLEQFELVDLSHLLSEDMPAWPGHMLFTHKVHNWYETVSGLGQPLKSTAAYYTCWYTIDEHCGTHFDAPSHFVPPPESKLPNAAEVGTLTGEFISLGQLRGPAAVVDTRSLNGRAKDGVSPRVTPEFFQAWEAENGAFRPDDVVIIRTGWDAYWTAGDEGLKFCWRPVVLRDHPGWPAPTAEAIDYLYERGIRLFCTDGPSIGAVEEQESMHLAGLMRGLVYVECLTNLDRLPPRGGYFMFMPLKLANSSGGNGRAAALIPRE